MEHNVDAIVAGVGTGGTATGLSRYFARVAPQVEIVLADPVGSVLADYVRTGKPGHGERSSLLDRAKRHGHEISRGGEEDSAIHLHGKRVGRAAHPRGTQLPRERLMLLATSGHEDLAAPR